MASPSAVPSAASLAFDLCQKYEKYGDLPAALNRYDLEGVARLIYSNNHSPLLLTKMVDWSPFRRGPNAGHDAVADFLGCGAIEFGVTTNYDVLVENSAAAIGEPDFRAAVDGVEAEEARAHRPYVKAHGCCVLNRQQTVWFREQLVSDPEIANNHQRTRAWLHARLHNRDLLFVGFWSDWAYLNDILADLLDGISPTVILVDPQDAATLEMKAPRLWAWAKSSARFEHVPESGADFLDELRRRFSLHFLNEMMRLGGVERFAMTTTTPNAVALRRDACGNPVGTPLRSKRPDERMELLALAHHEIRAKGGTVIDDHYSLGGETVRIVNGAGRMLNTVRRSYANEPPAPFAADHVVCAGAIDDGGAPAHLIRSGSAPTIVRAGSTGSWVTRVEDLPASAP